VVERALINKVLEENKFQASGLVDDSQISRMGEMMGANLVFVTNLTKMGNGNFYISFKLTNVRTAQVEKQQTTQNSRGMEDLVSVIKRVAGEMFGSSTNVSANRMEGSNRLVLSGTKAYQGGRRLSNHEAQDIIGRVNPNALALFDKGVSRNRTGNICIIAGGVSMVAGFVLMGGTEDDGLGLTIFCGGAGALAIGIPIKISGKKNLRESVRMYNQGISNASAELNFGITTNGVGLVVNF
jgi:hypothetical protein